MITRDFVTAGKAIFTILSVKTGRRFTYKINKVVKTDPKDGRETISYFVKLLTGPENTSDYTYLGVLEADSGAVILTRASKFNDESLPVQALRYVTSHLWANTVDESKVQINHAGRCGRCGHLLTTPESCARGIGPECIKAL